MTSLSRSRAQEIINLHEGIVSSMRRSVQDAIRIGELLTEAKADLDHGEFLPWIERELPFSNKTAESYMRLYGYRSKIESASNLQDAYRKVEQLEDQARQSERRAGELLRAVEREQGKVKLRTGGSCINARFDSHPGTQSPRPGHPLYRRCRFWIWLRTKSRINSAFDPGTQAGRSAWRAVGASAGPLPCDSPRPRRPQGASSSASMGSTSVFFGAPRSIRFRAEGVRPNSAAKIR